MLYTQITNVIIIVVDVPISPLESLCW